MNQNNSVKPFDDTLKYFKLLCLQCFNKLPPEREHCSFTDSTGGPCYSCSKLSPIRKLAPSRLVPEPKLETIYDEFLCQSCIDAIHINTNSRQIYNHIATPCSNCHSSNKPRLLTTITIQFIHPPLP